MNFEYSKQSLELQNKLDEFMQKHIFNNEKEILFWSERDGWGHYYLYDSEGNLKNQITNEELIKLNSLIEKFKKTIQYGK